VFARQQQRSFQSLRVRRVASFFHPYQSVKAEQQRPVVVVCQLDSDGSAAAAHRQSTAAEASDEGTRPAGFNRLWTFVRVVTTNPDEKTHASRPAVPPEQ